MIIDYPCNIHKKKLEICISFKNWDTGKNENKYFNPNEVQELILTRGNSSVSGSIFKLNPNLNIMFFSEGKPIANVLPMNKIPKILKNEELFYKLSKHKKRKLAWIFCKAVCSQRIKVISRLNETRNNEIVKQELIQMRKLDKKLSKAKTNEELMGIEGNIAKKFYFCLSNFNKLFNVKRNRFNKDIVNCLMNLSHTIIRNKIKYRLFIKGISPHHSFLHKRDNRNEDYLVWDFSEFWVAYCDKLIFYALERRIIKENDIIDGKLKMNEKNKIIKLVDKRISNEIIDNKINKFIGYLKGKNRFSWTQ